MTAMTDAPEPGMKTGRHRRVKPASDRKFGLLIAAVLAAIGTWLLVGGSAASDWLFGIAAVLAGIACVRPALLHRLNMLWFGFGHVLGRVVTPIVMVVLFAVAFTPIGLLARALGKDFLRMRRRVAPTSHWIERNESFDAKSMTRQF